MGTRRAAEDVKTGVLVCVCACVRERKREREIEREGEKERKIDSAKETETEGGKKEVVAPPLNTQQTIAPIRASGSFSRVIGLSVSFN